MILERNCEQEAQRASQKLLLNELRKVYMSQSEPRVKDHGRVPELVKSEGPRSLQI